MKEFTSLHTNEEIALLQTIEESTSLHTNEEFTIFLFYSYNFVYELLIKIIVT